MRKATTWLRSEVPRESLRVQSMWQAALAGGHGHGWVHGDICKLCGVSDADVRICPLCLLHSHPSCWLRVLRGACASGRCAVVNCASIPRFFSRAKCALCYVLQLCAVTLRRGSEPREKRKKKTRTKKKHLGNVINRLSCRVISSTGFFTSSICVFFFLFVKLCSDAMFVHIFSQAF
jgi:hypothetical protein